MNHSKLGIYQLEFHGHCGVTAQERDIGQRLTVDVTWYCDTTAAARSDRLCDTVDYDGLCNEILVIGEESRVCLVETLAEKIAQRVLNEPHALSVVVRVRKPARPPMRGGFVVEICRDKIARETAT